MRTKIIVLQCQSDVRKFLVFAGLFHIAIVKLLRKEIILSGDPSSVFSRDDSCRTMKNGERKF